MARLNGSDLNWSFFENKKANCLDCKKNLQGLKGKERTNAIEGLICKGHLIQYRGKGWSLYHNTNHNSVEVLGSMPLEAFTSHYLLQRALYEERLTRATKRILIERYNTNSIYHDGMRLKATMPLTNTGGYGILEFNQEMAIVGLFTDQCHSLRILSVETNQDAELILKWGQDELNLDEFIRTT